jgi:hypothetical protein
MGDSPDRVGMVGDNQSPMTKREVAAYIFLIMSVAALVLTIIIKARS